MNPKLKREFFESILNESENYKRRINHLIKRDIKRKKQLTLLEQKIDNMIEKIDFSLLLLKKGSGNILEN